MSSFFTYRIENAFGVAAIFAATAVASAQGMQRAQPDLAARHAALTSDDSSDDSHAAYSFKSRADSLAWVRNRSLATKASGFHLVVSLQDRHLWAVIGRDTVL